MYIYERYDFSLFESRFRDYDRHRLYSYEGLKELFNILSEEAEDSERPYELDVIAVCMEWTEVKPNLITETGCDSLEELQEKTIAVELDNGNILYYEVF